MFMKNLTLRRLIHDNQNLSNFSQTRTKVEELLKKFPNKQDIYIFAQGGSILSCEVLVRLKENDKNFHFITSVDEFSLNKIANEIFSKPNSMLIFITNSGQSAETLKQIDFFQKKNLIKQENAILFTGNENLLNFFQGEKVLFKQCEHFTSRYAFLSLPSMFVASLSSFNITYFYLGAYFTSLKALKNPDFFIESSEKIVKILQRTNLITFCAFEDSMQNLVRWQKHLAIEIFCQNSFNIYFESFGGNSGFHSKIQKILNFPGDKFFYITFSDEIDDFLKNSKEHLIKILNREKINFFEKPLYPKNEFSLGKTMFESCTMFLQAAKFLKINQENQQKFIDQFKYCQ